MVNEDYEKMKGRLIKYMKEKREIVDQELMKVLDVGKNATLRDAMVYLPSKGGKRLRPILAMLVADCISKEGMRALPYGLTLEIIHNFTLLHDDIMDKDDQRRGVPTVHKRWDEATAINAGDALFARAVEVLCMTDVSEEGFRSLVNDIGRMVRELGEGQQWDIEFEKRDTVTEQEYLDMIERKTGLMFKNAAKGGAIIGGGTKEQVDAMEEFGRLIGIAFQIQDDYLDLMADEKILKKPRGSDLRNGKRTILVIHARGHMNESQTARFDRVFGKGKGPSVEELLDAIEALEEAGSTGYAREKAMELNRKADVLLDGLPDNEEKELIRLYKEYLIYREF